MDAGCGPHGTTLAAVKKEMEIRFKGQIEAHGISMDIGIPADDGIILNKGDLRKNAGNESFYDIVYELGVLEYFESTKERNTVGRNMLKAVADGGICIFNYPYVSSEQIDQVHEIVAGISQKQFVYTLIPGKTSICVTKTSKDSFKPNAIPITHSNVLLEEAI